MSDTMSDLEIHEAGCDFRTIKCSFDGCQVDMMALEFDDHVDEMHIACENEDEGCEFNGSAPQNLEHQSQCSFRMVPCPERFCWNLVMERKVLHHVQQNHSPTEDCGGLDIVHKFILLRKDLSGKSWVMRLATYQGLSFVLQFEKSDEDKFYYAWVSVIGAASVANKYRVVITAEGNGCKLEMRHRKVYPIDVEVQEIMNDKECFRMSEDLVLLFREDNCDVEEREKDRYSHKLHVSYRMVLKP